MRFARALLIVLVSLLSVIGSRALAEICDDYPPVGMKPVYEYRGIYDNYAYGYEIVIPKGITGGLYQDPYAPQHGIEVILNWDPRSTIHFYGEANSAEDENGKPLSARGHCLAYISVVKEYARVISVSNVSTTRLGNHHASSVTISYTCENKPDIRVIEYVAAVSKERGLLYGVVLRTTQERHTSDQQVFRDIVRSFRLIEWK